MFHRPEVEPFQPLFQEILPGGIPQHPVETFFKPAADGAFLLRILKPQLEITVFQCQVGPVIRRKQRTQTLIEKPVPFLLRKFGNGNQVFREQFLVVEHLLVAVENTQKAVFQPAAITGQLAGFLGVP